MPVFLRFCDGTSRRPDCPQGDKRRNSRRTLRSASLGQTRQTAPGASRVTPVFRIPACPGKAVLPDNRWPFSHPQSLWPSEPTAGIPGRPFVFRPRLSDEKHSASDEFHRPELRGLNRRRGRRTGVPLSSPVSSGEAPPSAPAWLRCRHWRPRSWGIRSGTGRL